ncbi:MAG: Stp1/IreP family PP2C-type Ser/Thr phosphatase [Chloroflexi bacterium AL-W]|nr:Stp1/IreP family PP2C-type Ser/Thr phosphatase [Chloroflexi bacterium AL-N1]NOK68167.1 Stp1/IreP family PP2C-type Ser/Thr phosphatase [Chloroflexi bacterium AL-N10]NOK73507.1 Stp1/IreP family PP2C-type Ser/Thr phosphatase [Chloroflexi bacterium AL-N5]NOK83421.1 Stp1/IreP family PP2C-type Ser/Thr phosphatase [Chloroflexi bacterium AL-W]NOK87838.1 Stp1/IreP family PP2C-type Ser/Thr phosphatase [Chloroflexi bacterium AL-N15]
MRLIYNARTDTGLTRDHNEDTYGIGDDAPAERLGRLVLVCDGMGGHAAGEVASQTAVQTILAAYYSHEHEDRSQALEQAFIQANARIHERGQGTMGTTAVAALLHHDALHVANVGDSRAYLIRQDQIRQVSRDHSFVGDQVAAGIITDEQARSSPHRNVITRALGYHAEVSVDLFRLPLQVGDLILLSSDGLHGLVPDAELMQLATAHEPTEAVAKLIDLANTRGGEDNITVAIVRVLALDWDAQPITEVLNAETQPIAAIHQAETHKLSPDPTTVTLPATSAPTPQPVHKPAVSEASPTTERRLSRLGGVLAMLLLTILIFVTLFALQIAEPPTERVTPATLVPAQSAPATTDGATPTAPIANP